MKQILLFLTLIAININIQAQFYIEFNSGYAKGINNKTAFDNENSYTNKDYYNLDTSNYSQYNLAQGFFIEPRVGYKINNWLSASVGFYYNNNYKWTEYGNTINHFDNDEYIEMIYVSDSGQYSSLNHSYFSSNFSSKTVSINPELSFNKQFNKFSIKLNIGLSISNTTFLCNIDSNKSYYSSSLIMTVDSLYNPEIKTITQKKYKIKYHNDLKVSVRLGIEFCYDISNNFALSTKIYFNNLENTTNKKEQYYYYYKSVYQSKEEIINTITELDETVKEEETKGDLFGMNTLQFSFGIRYTFGKKEK